MTSVDDVACFSAVDRTGDPDFFVRFLDEANSLPSVRAGKATMLEELSLRRGQVALDVGCGTGVDVLAMAEVVGSDGRAVGVDLSEAMIGEARARSAHFELPVHYEVGDAQALPFQDDVFDACRAERVLMHVPDPHQALSEMVRVTRVGGRLTVFELDFDTLVLDCPHRDITRMVVRSLSDGIRHGRIGRRLPRMFDDSGLAAVRVTAHTVCFHYEFLELLAASHLSRLQDAGVLRPDQVKRWWASLLEAQESDCFFAAITGFIVSGTKA